MLSHFHFRPVRLHLPPDRRRQPSKGGCSGGGRSRAVSKRLLDGPVSPAGTSDLVRRAAAARQRAAGGGAGDHGVAALDVVREHVGADGGGAAAAADDPLPSPS